MRRVNKNFVVPKIFRRSVEHNNMILETCLVIKSFILIISVCGHVSVVLNTAAPAAAIVSCKQLAAAHAAAIR